jgi:deaminated glutathione amidase
MKIAVHQMCSGIDPLLNAAKMAEGIYQASEKGASFYFAPEMAILLDRDRARATPNIVSESENRALHRVMAAAKACGLWVHAGSLPVLSEGGTKYANRSVVIDPEGQVRARYDKMHLFDVDLSTGESWRESSAYAGGSGPVAVQTPLGLLGLTICYDLRFPDLYSAYSKAGVDILAIPAAFTVPTGQAHWHTMLRARAIETQTFVIAAAQAGSHEDGRATYGHSLVVDPWGVTLLDMGEGEELGFATLDLNRIAEVRAQIPVHANRRTIDMPVDVHS